MKNTISDKSGTFYRTIIMDACPFTRLGLMRILQSSFISMDIQECDNSEAINPLIFNGEIDYILMDICGKNESVLQGIRHIQRIKKTWPGSRLIICTSFKNANVILRLIKMGVSAICCKGDLPFALKKYISSVRTGRCYLSPAIETSVNTSSAGEKHWLTPKEMDVLGGLFEGHTVTDVSSILCRDVRTVSTHKQNAMEKFGFKNDYQMYIEGSWLFPDSVCHQ
ncbi:LuxR C-terminal-related transcriptional regulator [Rahnella laticis]|uniref:LuxR C-terminal-related transcriptional regulator n=1 Tax=Rahnella laticis TaxID=2787622 RepID=UPI0018A2C799|nr:response regulator transcription factor [Rahnella laticis]MBF7997776.1 response regulator transcription factor [Rahnella laticis]